MEYAREIREFVVANFLFGDGGALQDDTSFLNSGVIDSTGVLELITFLEEKYKIKVFDTETVPANLDSIHKVAGFLDRKLNQPA